MSSRTCQIGRVLASRRADGPLQMLQRGIIELLLIQSACY